MQGISDARASVNQYLAGGNEVVFAHIGDNPPEGQPLEHVSVVLDDKGKLIEVEGSREGTFGEYNSLNYAERLELEQETKPGKDPYCFWYMRNGGVSSPAIPTTCRKLQAKIPPATKKEYALQSISCASRKMTVTSTGECYTPWNRKLAPVPNINIASPNINAAIIANPNINAEQIVSIYNELSIDAQGRRDRREHRNDKGRLAKWRELTDQERSRIFNRAAEAFIQASKTSGS